MLKIRALIVDDEPLARERIRQMLKRDVEIEVVGECDNAGDAVNAIRRLRPDLLFLDIQMPRIDGFGVLRQLETDRIPGVIFVTAYDQYAVKGFEVHAFDYLLKPFKRKRFEQALKRFKDQFSGERGTDLSQRMLSLLENMNRTFVNRFVIPNDRGAVLIKVDEIDWFQSEDNYVRIHRGAETHLLRESLRNLEDQLDPQKFIRIHRTAIVNLDRIQELQTWFHRNCRVVLKNGTVIPISRRLKQKLSSILKKPAK